MAFDAFLKIEGIPGESSNVKHKGEIEVLSFSWNIKQSIATGGGKAQASDFMIVKHIDKASPLLMVAVCTGDHLRGDVLFTVEEPARSGKAGAAFLKIKLSEVLISSFQSGGGGTELPMDQVSLNFAKIEIAVRDDRGQWKEGQTCDLATGGEG